MARIVAAAGARTAEAGRRAATFERVAAPDAVLDVTLAELVDARLAER
jgi:hypothetical protein